MPRASILTATIKEICSDIISCCSESLKSKEYQRILDEQNHQWKDVYVVNDQVIPAMGVDNIALVQRIVGAMKKNLVYIPNFSMTNQAKEFFKR